MKKSIFILVLVFVSVFVFGQQLNPADYHIHRKSLANSFSKFKNEKQGRVVFLGGSITHNPGWRDSVCVYLQNKFSETKFDFINAGIPSMGSTPGAFRFERDVLKNGKVDLLFEEAAVNDNTNSRTCEEIQFAMEGIVRHAKRSNPECDLVFMYFVDPGKMNQYRNNKTPEEIQLHEKVAKHYNISAINLAKEITERIDNGEFTWKDDFKNLHPSPFGQGIYGNSIIQFLEDEYERISKGYKNTESKKSIEVLCESSYSKGILVEPNPPKPIKGWKMVNNWKPEDGKSTRSNYVDVPMLVGEFPAKILKFRFKGTAAGIAVAAGPDAGMIEYSVDNSPWQTQNLFTNWSRQLHLPWYYTLVSGLKNRNHTLQIRIADEKDEKSTGQVCRIRYFYFNEGE